MEAQQITSHMSLNNNDVPNIGRQRSAEVRLIAAPEIACAPADEQR